MMENLQSIIVRAKRVISSVMNIDERGIRFIRVEFNHNDLILYFSYNYRNFKVIAGMNGEIKSIEEIVSIEHIQNAFCIDRKAATIIISRKYPEWRIIDVENSRDGYIFKLQSDNKVKIVKVMCDGRVIQNYSIYKIIRKMLELVDTIIGRRQ